MSFAPANEPVSTAMHALTSAEKLIRQRRAAAAARAHAHAFQVKVALAVTCALAVPFGIGLYRGAVTSTEIARQQPAIEGAPNSDVRIGAIELPYRGELCRQLH